MRKKTSQTAAANAELEANKKLQPNNVAFADGFGDYEVGCDAETEFTVPRFNLKKRSKKHLRNDIRRNQERKEQEEQEQLEKEQEEQYRQEKLRNQQPQLQEEEEPAIVKEYLVYICQCCHNKFNTTNQFVNHSNSKKHKDNAKLYEEAGVIVTDVQLRTTSKKDDTIHDMDDEENVYEEEGEDTYHLDQDPDEEEEDNESSSDEESDPEEYTPPVGNRNLFAAFADDSSSSSSSSSDSEHDSKDEQEDDDDDDESKVMDPTPSSKLAMTEHNDNDNNDEPYDDDLDMLEEIIYQNRLQQQQRSNNPNDTHLEAHNDDDDDDKVTAAAAAEPLPFDDELYNPDYYSAAENRIVAVQHRLQKRLAERGVESSQVNPAYRTVVVDDSVVSIGKTLLQQVMEANMDTLQQKLEAYHRHKAECQLLGREFQFAKGNSKALPSQYTFRIDPSDNTRQRANVHHAGSHYHMQASRSMQFGRTKGMMARHSKQGARLQASRMAVAGGAKVGKTSKKSQQKRGGEAGGSKKTGGGATTEN